MSIFIKKDIGKAVVQKAIKTIYKHDHAADGTAISKEEELEVVTEDIIVSVPGEVAYEEKYNSTGVGLNNAQNKAGVMLKDHPWEDETNWELIIN